MKKAVTVIVWLILFAVLVAGIVFLYRYTNGFNEDLKTFYIARGGEKILTEKSHAEYAAGEKVRYDVGYTFDRPGSESREYSVKIVPNPEADFDFEANGLSFAWRLVAGLEEYFSLQQEADGFTFTVPEDYHSMADVLQSVYGGQEITLADDLPDTPFLLQVSSYNDAVRFVIAFSVVTDTFGIELSFTLSQDVKDVFCPEYAKAGEAVELHWAWTNDAPVTEDGASVKVTTKSGKAVPFTFVAGGIRFTMPAEAVIISVAQGSASEPDAREKYGIIYTVNDIGGEGYSTSADVKVDCVQEAPAGQEVVFTVTVGSGYEIVEVSAKDGSRAPAADVRYENGHYVFTMPAENVVLEILIQRKYGG